MKNCPYRHDENVQKECFVKKDVKLNKRKRDEAERIKESNNGNGGNGGDVKESKEVVMKESKNKKGKKS